MCFSGKKKHPKPVDLYVEICFTDNKHDFWLEWLHRRHSPYQQFGVGDIGKDPEMHRCKNEEKQPGVIPWV